MRPANKRQQGRGSRRGGNGFSRTYESNGPDVKLRGSAPYLSERYLQLARDAHASGDSVVAERYLQYSEHYSRLVAQAQQGRSRPSGEDEGLSEDWVPGRTDRFASYDTNNSSAPNSEEAGEGANVSSEGSEEEGERPLVMRQPMRERGERGGRGSRGPQTRPIRERSPRPDIARVRPQQGEEDIGLPAFITDPARSMQLAQEGEGEAESFQPQQEHGDEGGWAGFHLRPRRRRRRPLGRREGEPREGFGETFGAPRSHRDDFSED